MCGIVRCVFLCGMAVFVAVAVMRMIGIDPGYQVQAVPRLDVSHATSEVRGGDAWTIGRTSSWESLLTTPVLQSKRPSTWVDPYLLPFYRAMYTVRNFLSIPVVFLTLLGLLAAVAIRRRRERGPKRRRNAVPPESFANARKQAAIIDRMHGMMDRIETRVERLESALLP